MAETEQVEQESGCFVCSGALPTEPEDDLDPRSYYYVFGFADGVSTALKSEGYRLCDHHRGLIVRALRERGIAWRH